MRVVHALVGGLIGVAWLVLPGMAIGGGGPVAGGAERPVAGAVGQGEVGETSAADLVMPMLAVVVVLVLAGFGFLRRRRRARERTTPGGAPVQVAEPQVAELDERARVLLVEADDWVRVSREELGFVEGRVGIVEGRGGGVEGQGGDVEGQGGDVEGQGGGVEGQGGGGGVRPGASLGAADVEPFTRVLRDAEAELAVAFRMRWQYEGGVPGEDAARRHVLAGIVGRAEEAGRLLDAQAAAFDQLRGLEEGLGGGLGEALAVAEARFRELAGRTGGAGAAVRELGERYAPSAVAVVVGHVEQAKDRLVFATARLNHARQSADLDANERAAGQLRSAEGAIAQAAVFIDAIDRLAGELATAAALVPAALTGGEAEIAGARQSLAGVGATHADVPPGELRARVAHADVVLAGVREDLTAGPYDPLDLLRRIVRGVGPVVAGRAGVLPAAALLCARSAVAAADDVIATHRAAVADEARTRLAEARRLLTSPPPAPTGRDPRRELADLLTADTLAQRARELAEQDARMHGHPIDGPGEDADGLAGAVLGGVLLGDDPNADPPASFGGPHTRGRRGGTAPA